MTALLEVMPPPPTPVAMALPQSTTTGLASTEPDSNYYDYVKDVDENLNCSICRSDNAEPFGQGTKLNC